MEASNQLNLVLSIIKQVTGYSTLVLVLLLVLVLGPWTCERSPFCWARAQVNTRVKLNVLTVLCCKTEGGSFRLYLFLQVARKRISIAGYTKERFHN